MGTIDWERIPASDFIYENDDDNNEVLNLLSELDNFYTINQEKSHR
jgi:hypothetical protein